MRTFLFIISYCFALTTGFGQQLRLTLTHPLDGAVYQRDDTGWGTVNIGGTFNSILFKNNIGSFVRARLVELNVSDGNTKPGGSTYIIPVQRRFLGTSFSGSIRVPGGWYRIEAEAVRRVRQAGDPNSPPQFVEEIIETISSKVGIGEVFIISGQSNAQGLPNSPGDVNIAQTNLDFDGVRMQPVNVGPNAELPKAFYVSISAPTASYDQIRSDFVKNTVRAAQTPTNQGIAPTGNSLWYWSYVGQKLAQRYNVPIAFYNVAFGGTHIKAWAQSTDNQSEPDGAPVISGTNRYGPGAPYRILRTALRLYGSIYGVRSILWLQGETDAKALNEKSQWLDRSVDNAEDYKNRLQRVIQQTRTDFGPVPWIVGQTSIVGGDPNVVKDSPISLLIANGQSLAATTSSSNPALQVSVSGSSVGSQVFLGPNMNNSVTVRRTPGSGYADEPVHSAVWISMG